MVDNQITFPKTNLSHIHKTLSLNPNKVVHINSHIIQFGKDVSDHDGSIVFQGKGIHKLMDKKNDELGPRCKKAQTSNIIKESSRGVH